MPPPLYVPPPPRRSSLAPLWITLGVVFAVVLVVCASCSVLIALNVRGINTEISSVPPVPLGLHPVLAAANFCAYETNKDYEHAYAQLSNTMRSQLSEQQFISDNQARDATAGPVVGCSAALLKHSEDQTGASSTVTLMVHVWLGSEAGNGPPTGESGTMTMVQDSSGWKVDSIDGALQLT
jgi:hypothetical protein